MFVYGRYLKGWTLDFSNGCPLRTDHCEPVEPGSAARWDGGAEQPTAPARAR